MYGHYIPNIEEFKGLKITAPTIDNPYYNRTGAIEEELAKHGIKAKVSRHHLFDINYIVVKFDKTQDFIHNAEEKMSKILDIPKSWIGMVLCCDPRVYYIKEKEFTDKYPHIDEGKPLFEKTINLFTYRDSHFVPITIEEAREIWRDQIRFEEEIE